MSKILIIEDEPDTAKVVTKRLTQGGFEVVAAVDAYEGVKFAHKEKPDLEIRYTPVVVLTGIKNEEYKQQILDKGVEAYLEKPYDPDVLLSTIRNILNK